MAGLNKEQIDGFLMQGQIGAQVFQGALESTGSLDTAKDVTMEFFKALLEHSDKSSKWMF